MERIADHYPISAAATACGVHRRTLLSAVERGEVPCQRLGNGTPVVRLPDVRRWAGQTRRPGPKGNGAAKASMTDR